MEEAPAGPGRTIGEARIIDALRRLIITGAKGRPRPGIACGRRKMAQWQRRHGLPALPDAPGTV